MSTTIRARNEGERRWFFGGGLHVWKLAAEETDGQLILFEDFLDHGKVTPMHRHAGVGELVYVIEGTLAVHVDGAVQEVGPGGVAWFGKGVPHALMCTSPGGARILSLQTPGGSEGFYREASEPEAGSARPVDFHRLGAVARARPAEIEILGPPPFGPRG